MYGDVYDVMCVCVFKICDFLVVERRRRVFVVFVARFGVDFMCLFIL